MKTTCLLDHLELLEDLYGLKGNIYTWITSNPNLFQIAYEGTNHFLTRVNAGAILHLFASQISFIRNV